MKKESKIKLFIYYLSCITTVLYILYRILFTIPNANLITIIFAILVLIFETTDALFYIVYVFNIIGHTV